MSRNTDEIYHNFIAKWDVFINLQWEGWSVHAADLDDFEEARAIEEKAIHEYGSLLLDTLVVSTDSGFRARMHVMNEYGFTPCDYDTGIAK